MGAVDRNRQGTLVYAGPHYFQVPVATGTGSATIAKFVPPFERWRLRAVTIQCSTVATTPTILPAIYLIATDAADTTPIITTAAATPAANGIYIYRRPTIGGSSAFKLRGPSGSMVLGSSGFAASTTYDLTFNAGGDIFSTITSDAGIKSARNLAAGLCVVTTVSASTFGAMNVTYAIDQISVV